ncbi:hypothetical protein [Kibdelosporangium philippinense]|uniref:hypothetical protein n=1 Tax=Kibdelosporangium philippinense TaxID=211113 RepID=UPI0036095300
MIATDGSPEGELDDHPGGHPTEGMLPSSRPSGTAMPIAISSASSQVSMVATRSEMKWLLVELESAALKVGPNSSNIRDDRGRRRDVVLREEPGERTELPRGEDDHDPHQAAKKPDHPGSPADESQSRVRRRAATLRR